MSDRVRERVRELLRTEVDWDFLLRLARNNRVAALLYWQLRATGGGSVPKDVLTTLWAQFETNARCNAARLQELCRLLALLDKQGISVVLFKGPALAAEAYGGLNLREFEDLDLLISPGDFISAAKLLLAEGYHTTSDVNGLAKANFLRVNEVAFRSPERAMLIDLHLEVMPSHFPFSPRRDRLFEHARTLDLQGHRVLGLSAEDSLSTVCAHGCKHSWLQLSWICDVAELMHLDLDWSEIEARARETHSERMLWLGLALARDLLDAQLPVQIEAQIKRHRVLPSLVNYVRTALSSDREKVLPILWPLPMRAIERNRDKLWFCLDLVKPRLPEFNAVSLPRMLFPAYYLLRPLRLGIKYGTRFLRRLSTA